MSSSTLHVAGLFVVSSDDVPLTTEYALFDAGDIELRASGPGTVREMGYNTTAKSARERLEAQGIDARLVAGVEDALRSHVAAAFSRGDAVRALVPYMSAGELLDGGIWLAEEQMYQGTSLHLADLARACGVAQASLAFQAIALAGLLADVPDDAPVVLSTLDYTRDRRPGERTHRRVSLEHAAEIESALRKISLPDVAVVRTANEPGPSRGDLLESLRKRAEIVTSQGGKDRMIRFERALAERQMPAKGPLSDSAAWRLEVQLAKGQVEGINETLDSLEKMRGRSPTTAYLRARAQLVSGEVEPRMIAEKVSALGMSINSAFPELDLLIAESWAAAGEARRALPYARDLVANPTLHAELRARAEAIVNHPEARGSIPPPNTRVSHGNIEAPGSASPSGTMPSVPPLPLANRPSSRPPQSPSHGLGGASEPQIKMRVPTSIPPMGVAPPSLPPGAMNANAPPSIPQGTAPPSAMPSTTRGSNAYAAVRPPEDMPDLDDLPRVDSIPPALSHPSPPPAAKRTPTKTLRPDMDALDRGRPASQYPSAYGHTQSKPTRPPVRPPSQGTMPGHAPPAVSLEEQDRGGSALDLVDSRHVSSRPGTATGTGTARPSSEYHAVRATPSHRPSQVPPPPSQRGHRASYVPADPRAEPGSTTTHFTAAQEVTHDDIVELSIAPASSSRMPSQRPSREMQATKPPPPIPAAAAVASAPPRRASDPTLRTEFMRGASQPSFKAHQLLAPAPPTLAPMFPRSDPQTLELASSLDLPYGLGDQRWSGTGAPRSVLEARLHFVHLSRQLGNMYKQNLGVELTADVAGIEAMQRHLLERFGAHVLQNAEDAEEARRHGAFLSEILIRRLNAEWVDIASTDLGYWGMLLGNDTRVWPFGRVLRYISLGHKERDLVSYFLELQTRIKS